jgi:hypothetical protein
VSKSASHHEKLSVVIAGGGVAALETALALADLAPDRTDVTVIAPNIEFVYRPMIVREPFAYGSRSATRSHGSSATPEQNCSKVSRYRIAAGRRRCVVDRRTARRWGAYDRGERMTAAARRSPLVNPPEPSALRLADLPEHGDWVRLGRIRRTSLRLG